MAEAVLSVRVTGRVQGVWYRGWTQRTATALGVSGWVRNEADGSVTALVGGTQSAVDAMLAAMRQGPGPARVETVETQPSEEAPGDGFRVLR